MKIYQVEHGEQYEGGYNIGIYSSKASADNALSDWEQAYSESDASWHWTSITELELLD